MTIEQKTRNFNPGTVLEILKGFRNRYFLARFLEICSLLDYIQEIGVLKRENIEGKIFDLGTGSGIGMLALRQFGQGELVGVDNQKYWNDPNPYTGCFNRVPQPIPQPEIIEAASAGFEGFDVRDFLDIHWVSGDKASLITAFYANLIQWTAGFPKVITGIDVEECLDSVYEEIGNILPSGGQFILTFDQNYAKRPSWAKEEFSLTGTGGEFSRTLELPFPKWLKECFWGLICTDRERRNFSELDFLLEDEIFKTQGQTIGLIRDMMIRVYTK